MTISWNELLDDFEDLLEQVQHNVDLGEWADRDVPGLDLRAPIEGPTPEQAARLDDLTREARDLMATVERLQNGVRDQLQHSRRGAQASRAYLGSTA